MCMNILFGCLNVCVCTVCMPGAKRDQKRTSDPLELELQIVICCCVVTGNQTLVLYKNIRCITIDLSAQSLHFFHARMRKHKANSVKPMKKKGKLWSPLSEGCCLSTCKDKIRWYFIYILNKYKKLENRH